MLKQRVGITPAVVGLLVAVLAASWLHDHTNAGQPAIVAQDLLEAVISARPAASWPASLEQADAEQLASRLRSDAALQSVTVEQELRAHDVYRVEAQLTADAPRQDATTVTLRLQRTDTGWQASLTDIKGS